MAFYNEGDLDDWIDGSDRVSDGPRSREEELLLQCLLAYNRLSKSRAMKWQDATVAAGKAVELAAQALKSEQVKRMVAYARRF